MLIARRSVLLFALIACLATAAPAATFIVTNNSDSGPGSLRQALTDASVASPATVIFVISGSKRIPLQSPLTVPSSVVVDGTTQAGYTGKPVVEIDASQIAGVSTTQCVNNHGTINGLAIGKCVGVAVFVDYAASLTNSYVGLDATGRTPFPNGGGVQTAAGTITNNVISGNTTFGILLDSANNATVRGNWIGTDANGFSAIPNATGISVRYTTAYQAIVNNHIAGNSGYAIDLSNVTGCVIQYNWIGGGASGFSDPNGYPVPNGRGINIYQTNQAIVTSNLIRGTLYGPAVEISRTSTGNRVTQNLIYGNGFGIALETVESQWSDVVNDFRDNDSGPNLLQNYPVINGSRSVAGATTITGTLNSTPNQTYTIEFFSSQSCNALAAQGEQYLGYATVTTDSNGDAPFDTSFPVMLTPSMYVTATATDANGNTSQFSRCVSAGIAGTLSLSWDMNSVMEGVARATVTVQRRNGTYGAVTVDYATHDGTATAPSDYATTSGTLTLADGESSKTFTIPIVDDAIPEAMEQFTVTLSNPTGGATLVWPSTQTIMIADNDPVTISIDDVTITEGNAGWKDAIFTISLSAPWPGTFLSLDASVGGGSAVANRDYERTGGPFIFRQGDQKKTLSVPIYGNTIPELTKTFNVTISRSYSIFYYGYFYYDGGYYQTYYCCTPEPIIAKSRGTCTIINDDHVIYPYVQQLARGKTGLLTLIVGQGSAVDETISLVSSAPDTVSVPATIKLPAGWTGVTIPVTAKNAGGATIVAKLPASLDGSSMQAAVNVFDENIVNFTPGALVIPAGTNATVTVSLQPPLIAAQTMYLAVGDPTIASVPASVLIPAGESAAFTVSGLKRGGTSIAVTTSLAPLPLMIPVDVTEATTGPAIFSAVPANGPASGGTSVTLNGANFGAACSVTFGGVPATIVSTTPSSIIVTAPPHLAGPVAISVTCGTSEGMLANGFTYLAGAPIVDSVAPSFGSIGGGTVVRISGDRFTSRCWPFFGTAAGVHAAVISPAEIIVTTPPHPAGAVDVSLRCSGSENGFLAKAFAFGASDDAAPVIDSIAPLFGMPGQSITIGGLRFRNSDTVTFDTTRAVVLSTAPDAHVVTLPDLSMGKASVNVTDTAGHLSTSGPIFTVLEAGAPKIDSITPLRVGPGGELTIRGSGFRASRFFTLGSTRLTTIATAYDAAVVRVPNTIAPGTYELDAVNAAGDVAANGSPVTVVAGMPVITSIAPRCATVEATGSLSISGSGFAPGATVTVAGIRSPAVTVVNSSQITAALPSGEVGTASIAVTNPDGNTGTFTAGFRYMSPYDPDGCTPRPRPALH